MIFCRYPLTIMANNTTSRYESIVDEIGPQIVDGVLTPGITLKLADLEDAYSISRTVAREVQRCLEGLGLVHAQRRVGMVVLDKEQWHVFDPSIIRWRLSGKNAISSWNL